MPAPGHVPDVGTKEMQFCTSSLACARSASQSQAIISLGNEIQDDETICISWIFQNKILLVWLIKRSHFFNLVIRAMS